MTTETRSLQRDDINGEFSVDMLVLARESRGLTQKDLAENLSVSQSRVSKIEAGLIAVSDMTEVERIGSVLDYPATFFLQDRVDRQPSLYRRRLRIPQKALTCCEARISIFVMHIERLLKATEILKEQNIPRIDPDELNGDVPEIARRVREHLGIPRGPVRTLIPYLESVGCLVAFYDFGKSKIDGVSAVLSDGTPLILLSPTAPPDRIRRTVTHEFGHVVMHRRVVGDEEAQADAFASEFLMPARDIRSEFYPVSLDTFARLKLRWQTSMQSLVMRAAELGAITERQKYYMMVNMAKRGYRMAEPHSDLIKRESPALIKKILQCHFGDMGMTESDLMRQLRINHADLHEFLRITQGDGGLRVVA